MTEENIKSEQSIEHLLVEYQAAQDSAQHHDNQVWHLTSMVWASNFILLGIIMDRAFNPKYSFFVIFLAILGILLTRYSQICQKQWRDMKNQKYTRCKEIEKTINEVFIEEKYHMTQHLNAKWQTGSQTNYYNLIAHMIYISWLMLIIISVISNYYNLS